MIIVIGEILFDIFDNYRRIGGAPFNFAYHLKRLGWPVRFLSRVGDDENGRQILSLIEKSGFSTGDIQVDSRHPTGTVTVELDDEGTPRFDICKPVAYDNIDIDMIQRPDWKDVRLLYFGSLAQRTDGGFHRIQSFIQKRLPGTHVFCDVNLRPPHVHDGAVEASLRAADIVKLNTGELLAIGKIAGGPGSETDAVDWAMRTFGIRWLILTRGGAGSSLVSDGKTVNIAPVQGVRIVDTVGAGDAYAAVTAAGLLKKVPLETVGRLAAMFSAKICALEGAVPENPSFYDSLGSTLKGEP